MKAVESYDIGKKMVKMSLALEPSLETKHFEYSFLQYYILMQYIQHQGLHNMNTPNNLISLQLWVFFVNRRNNNINICAELKEKRKVYK